MSIETMTKLSTVTVGAGGSATISFTNIPQTYTDLRIVVSPRVSGSATPSLWMDINDSTSGYSGRFISGNGASAGSGTRSYAHIDCGVVNYSTTTSNTFSSHDIYIPNYTSSNNKSISIDVVQETNGTTAYMYLHAGLWSNTAAITKLVFTAEDASNFAQYSTATLYGIRNARRATGNSIKATGGNISFDGTYVVHTFASSGTFTPTTNLRADYLVVAGGGGGGGNIGGGGGAGGVKTSIGGTALSLSSEIDYTVTVGAGGVGGNVGPSATITTNSAAGSNSSISGGSITAVTSTGGGRGGDDPYQIPQNGGNGGSGGGGASRIDLAGTSTGGTGNAGEGNNGGSTSANGAAGGGGAGAVGGNGAAGVSGAGGAGISNSITGSSVTYGGGGGGGGLSGVTVGAGGSGGGGAGGGATNQTGTAGSANTGGGGGGGGGGNGSATSIGGAGGSGVVIIRYKA